MERDSVGGGGGKEERELVVVVAGMAESGATAPGLSHSLSLSFSLESVFLPPDSVSVCRLVSG